MSDKDREVLASYTITSINKIDTVPISQNYPNNILFSFASTPPTSPRQFLIDTSNLIAFENIRNVLLNFFPVLPNGVTLGIQTTGIVTAEGYGTINGVTVSNK